MQISATVSLGLDISTIFDSSSDAYASVATNTLSETGLSERFVLNSASTPAVSKKIVGRVALVAGVATIDLTSFTNADGTVTNATGLRLIAVKIRGLSTNAAAVQATVGASNGYALDNGTFKAKCSPNASCEMYLLATAPIIGSGAKTLDLSGTGTDVLEIAAVFG